MELDELTGAAIPDTAFGINDTTLPELFTVFGAKGIEVYQQIIIYDLLLPISYALFFGAIIFLLYRGSKFKYLAWIPVCASIFDYIENYLLANCLSQFPNINNELANITGSIISIKLVFLISSLLIIIVASVQMLLLSKRK
tara:strand:- start:1424 stop:1846 length:423 start_codon:yes stop_codon:yes gene_type:complete